MKLGTIKHLGEIITGDKSISPYRSEPKLVGFSNGQGFSSRWSFAEDCIRQFNGTPTSTGTKVAKGGDRRSERSPTFEEPPGHSGVPADYKSVENSGLPDINLQISNRTASRIPVCAESLGSFALIPSLILKYGEDESLLKLSHRFRASHTRLIHLQDNTL